MSSRADAEKVRIREHIKRLRVTIDAAEMEVETATWPLDGSSAEALGSATFALQSSLLRLSAYKRSEEDLEKKKT